MQFFKVKNWEDLQHYKDRAPPWIKLYNHLLDDYEFACLQDASKLHLILIWLLASRTSNRMPFNENWIRSKIGANSDVDLNALVDAGFLVLETSNGGGKQSAEHDASKVLATSKQSACLEERRGEERESKEEREQRRDIVDKKSPKSSDQNLIMQRVFEHWINASGRSINKSKLTSDRKARIRARLKDGYTESELIMAIDGCMKDPWFSENQNELEYILRKGSHVEKFKEVFNKKQTNNSVSEITKQNLKNLEGGW